MFYTNSYFSLWYPIIRHIIFTVQVEYPVTCCMFRNINIRSCFRLSYPIIRHIVLVVPGRKNKHWIMFLHILKLGRNFLMSKLNSSIYGALHLPTRSRASVIIILVLETISSLIFLLSFQGGCLAGSYLKDGGS
jgi:hypothetical protein